MAGPQARGQEGSGRHESGAAARVTIARLREQVHLSRRAVFALIVGGIILVTGGKLARPFARGWAVSDELLRMDSIERSLVAENEARADELRFYNTAAGKEVLARRKGMVAPGEVLVNPVARPAAAQSPTPLTPQRSVQLWIAESRQGAASWVHHSEAVVQRWTADPPEVRAARELARQKRHQKAARKPKPEADATLR